MTNINWPCDFYDSKLSVISTNITTAIVNGQLKGFLAGYRYGEKNNISQTQMQTLDDGSSPPQGPTGARVVSTSNNDSINGTGAQKVRIVYLDGDWNLKSETVQLNGTTPVSLNAQDIYHIEAFYVIQVGSNGAASGNITLQNPTGSQTFLTINAGFNQSFKAVAHVPKGYTMLINQFTVSSNGGYCKFYLCVYKNFEHINGGNNILFVTDIIGVNSMNFTQNFFIPIIVTEKHSVKITAIANKNGVSGFGGFWFYLQPKAVSEYFY
ncbi:hypothetical protein [Thermobrachium celere]|uniref:Uncharacterized protein n=1 Tax=Thermobrachium celere DSM 8682 TaxID=941824 RepID=R7RQ88_9CLOT|nr:hypothetical protein [Thermobrachium celere]CDF58382.1 hypothetical protein TCEL_00428 [Thermobrachium celere DSM 8682]